MITRVEATFQGRNGSCGYKTGKNYVLKVHHATKGRFRGYITIEPIGHDECTFCEYNSIHALFKNWDNIKNVKIK